MATLCGFKNGRRDGSLISLQGFIVVYHELYINNGDIMRVGLSRICYLVPMNFPGRNHQRPGIPHMLSPVNAYIMQEISDK
jgi:hypothetical protein